MDYKNRWRTGAFRKQIIEKIEEEALKSHVSSTKSAQELENEEFQKAATEQEYSISIARLILNMRRTRGIGNTSTTDKRATSSVTLSKPDDSNHPVNQQSTSAEDQLIEATEKFKNRRSFVCAVCCSTFTNKTSIKNHINRTQHFMVSKSLPKFIESMLPQQWIFTLCSYLKTNIGYKLEICLPNITSIDLTQEWMKEFAKLNNCVYVWERSCSTQNSSCQKVTYGCRYSRKRTSEPNKSKISFLIKQGKISYSTVTLDLDYDHLTASGDDPRQYQPSAEVKEILFKYFENATNPVEAYRNFQVHVETQLDSENEYLEYITDRRKMPVLSWVRQLYNSEYKAPQIGPNEDLELLKQFVNDKNEEYGECVCKFQELPNNNFAIFIVTAYMKRAQQSQAAGELIYTDNFGSVARYGLKVFLILTNIKGEAVPLGVMISSSETNKAIKSGFNLFSAYLDEYSFNGKGAVGPAIIMTDDSMAEIASMKSCFPYSKIVLSVYHFLRACYKWLVKIEHRIYKQNREIIYASVRRMVYADNESILRDEFEKVAELFKNNELISNYVCKLYEKRQTWALCYRPNFVSMDSRGDRWKYTMSTLREQISSRIKLLEPRRLMLYFLNEFSDFYRRRLIDCALDRYTNEHRLPEDETRNYTIAQSEQCESLFTVQDSNTGVKYLLNIDINSCTCYLGSTGLCEHQKILNAFVTQSTIEVGDTETKLELYYIVSGSKDVPEEFFGLSDLETFHLNSHQSLQTEQFFDNGVGEETVIEDHSQHVQLQHVTQFSEIPVQGIEVEPSSGEENPTPQVYPIIIDSNVEDESIVQIDESTSFGDNIRVESVPKIIYSIVTDENIDEIEVEDESYINDLKLFDNIDENDGNDTDERLKLELIKFNENFTSLRNTISKDPNYYEHGLRYLNGELKKLKNDPKALLHALSTFKS